MIGVVLCGGNSTRMGADKGLLKEEEETWAEIAFRKLASLQLPVVVSVSREQFPMYEPIFSKEQLVVDDKHFDAKAPLFGLLSVHLHYPGTDLFVLACDMKDMRPELMENLYNQYKQEKKEVYVYQTGETPQPLCGIYKAGGLKKVYTLFQEGKLGRFSMMHVLDISDTMYVMVNEEDFPAFNNYNNPHDH